MRARLAALSVQAAEKAAVLARSQRAAKRFMGLRCSMLIPSIEETELIARGQKGRNNNGDYEMTKNSK